jgi:hypothetical protein
MKCEGEHPPPPRSPSERGMARVFGNADLHGKFTLNAH